MTDLARIVAVARQTLDADVFCFQEVSANFSRFGDGAGSERTAGSPVARLLRNIPTCYRNCRP
ncbi:hypothetical protein [Bradyrhizobium sp. 177]|uniref:hypothetical protein n=1 Tax=Bradyrhizobium sp. 177 TaxID=2782647 RepID=UPI003211AF6E